MPFPLVVWIHGGAWLSGLKEWNNVKYLVRNGYAIASVDYRFSPEAPFPAQIQDCNAALNFIVSHATNYGISRNNLSWAAVLPADTWRCFWDWRVMRKVSAPIRQSSPWPSSIFSAQLTSLK